MSEKKQPPLNIRVRTTAKAEECHLYSTLPKEGLLLRRFTRGHLDHEKVRVLVDGTTYPQTFAAFFWEEIKEPTPV